jgi:ribosomal protein S21
VLCSAGLIVAFVQFVSSHHALAEAKFKDSCVQVLVRDNNVDQALKALKKKMQREGIFREMKLMKSRRKSVPAKRRRPFAAHASWPAKNCSVKGFCRCDPSLWWEFAERMDWRHSGGK